MNRLTGVDYSDSTPDVTYAYDHARRRTSMTDGIGTEDYDYDDADRLTDVTRGTDTFHYDYDQLNITGRTYPDGTSITATYNDDEELATLTTASNTTTLTYDPAGRLSTTAYPAGNGYTETRNLTTEDRVGSVPNPASWTLSYNTAETTATCWGSTSSVAPYS